MYACGFRFYFTPLPGFFSPFPHGTGSLSVDYEYLALEDGPHVQTRFHVPRPTFRKLQYHGSVFAYGAITHYGRTFHSVLLTIRYHLQASPFRLATTLGNLG